MNNYIKKVKGKLSIMARDKSCADNRSMNSQNSLIFNELMEGKKLTLASVQGWPIYSNKLATRKSDIQAALNPYGITIQHLTFINMRGAYYFVYYLKETDIKKLLEILS